MPTGFFCCLQLLSGQGGFSGAASACFLGIDGQRPVNFNTIRIPQNPLGLYHFAEYAEFVKRKINFGKQFENSREPHRLLRRSSFMHAHLAHDLFLRQGVDDFDFDMPVHESP